MCEYLKFAFVYLCKLYLESKHANLQPSQPSTGASTRQPLLPVLDQKTDVDVDDTQNESMDADQLLNEEKKALVRRKRHLRNKVRV